MKGEVDLGDDFDAEHFWKCAHLTSHQVKFEYNQCIFGSFSKTYLQDHSILKGGHSSAEKFTNKGNQPRHPVNFANRNPSIKGGHLSTKKFTDKGNHAIL